MYLKLINGTSKIQALGITTNISLSHKKKHNYKESIANVLHPCYAYRKKTRIMKTTMNQIKMEVKSYTSVLPPQDKRCESCGTRGTVASIVLHYFHMHRQESARFN